jgi:hypothetical protein
MHISDLACFERRVETERCLSVFFSEIKHLRLSYDVLNFSFKVVRSVEFLEMS